jgi:hypothetical protein
MEAVNPHVVKYLSTRVSTGGVKRRLMREHYPPSVRNSQRTRAYGHSV